MESARKDLDVIFKKINNSLTEFQSGAPVVPDVEKITKSEVSFQIEDHEDKNIKPPGTLAPVTYAPEFSSLPFRRYKNKIEIF